MSQFLLSSAASASLWYPVTRPVNDRIIPAIVYSESECVNVCVCVCVCVSAPDSQHGVDFPDEVAELVHDLLQLLVLLLQLLQEK